MQETKLQTINNQIILSDVKFSMPITSLKTDRDLLFSNPPCFFMVCPTGDNKSSLNTTDI